jgi:hypothetical protein
MTWGYNWKDDVKMARDRDVITQANRRVDEMQQSVAANRALIERTRILIARISRLLAGGSLIRKNSFGTICAVRRYHHPPDTTSSPMSPRWRSIWAFGLSPWPAPFHMRTNMTKMTPSVAAGRTPPNPEASEIERINERIDRANGILLVEQSSRHSGSALTGSDPQRRRHHRSIAALGDLARHLHAHAASVTSWSMAGFILLTPSLDFAALAAHVGVLGPS